MLIRDGEKRGGGGMEVGGEGDYIPIANCHHQNDSYTKMGSDESHFNVSLTVRDKVTRQCPQTAIFEEKGELKRIRTEVPSAYQPNALPLGQTGSQVSNLVFHAQSASTVTIGRVAGVPEIPAKLRFQQSKVTRPAVYRSLSVKPLSLPLRCRRQLRKKEEDGKETDKQTDRQRQRQRDTQRQRQTKRQRQRHKETETDRDTKRRRQTDRQRRRGRDRERQKQRDRTDKQTAMEREVVH